MNKPQVLKSQNIFGNQATSHDTITYGFGDSSSLPDQKAGMENKHRKKNILFFSHCKVPNFDHTSNSYSRGRNRNHTLQKANIAWMQQKISTYEYKLIINRYSKINQRRKT
jgi:hypothetical protein